MTRTNSCRALRLLALALIAILLAACAQTSVVDNWKTDQPVANKPDKVAVIAVLPEALLRKAVENDVVKILADRGTPAVVSSDIPGMSGGIRGEIDVEVATGLLRKAGVDGIVVMFYAGGERGGEYERSNYWVEYLGSGVGYSWASPYFVDVYTVRQGADIISTTQTVFVESSYFDMETEQPVWRIVTKTKDIEHTDAALDIAKQVASEMRSAGLN